MAAERIDVLAVMDDAYEMAIDCDLLTRAEQYREARAAVAELIEENQCLRLKANLWDDLMAARAQAHAEPDSVEWKRLARSGDAIAAIKSCRATNGCSLREAKDCVEGYMGRGRP